MALEVGSTPEQSVTAQVIVSELHELNFALFLLQCHDGHRVKPWVAPFRRDHADVYEGVRAFWSQESDETGQQPLTEPDYLAWDEMLVAAHHMGALRDQTLHRFFEQLPGTLERELTVPPLPTETAAVSVIVQRRLEALRRSPALRNRYVDTLRQTWEALRPVWESQGRAAVMQAARALTVQPASIDDLRKMAPGCSMLRREDYEDVINKALERREVVIVPLWFAADGQSLFSLPGTLLVGVGLESSRKVERKRAQAEKAAGRLKVLSDPTRVAMLMQLLHGGATITDLSNYLELSQPTVSVHMKALREAGLVTAEKLGNQTKYRTDPEVVRAHVSAALREIGIELPV